MIVIERKDGSYLVNDRVITSASECSISEVKALDEFKRLSTNHTLSKSIFPDEKIKFNDIVNNYEHALKVNPVETRKSWVR